MQIGVGLLLLVGFGAKLGLLPFYEWFPGAYGSGSGASGAILSGAVLNAAFFGLSRGLMEWLPPAPDGAFPLLAVIVIVIATISAILTILYAFPTGRLAAASELFHLPRTRQSRSSRSARPCSFAAIGCSIWPALRGRSRCCTGRPCSGEGVIVSDRGRIAPSDRNLRHHDKRRGEPLAVRRRSSLREP